MMKCDYPRRVEIICEGYEEYDYFCKLKDLDVFSKQYSIKLKNAKGVDNLFSVYSNEFQNNNSEVLFILCDTDMEPYKKYEKLCKNVNAFHDSKRISNEVVLFVNPCSMQMMLMHFADIKLKSNQKSANSSLICKYTGIKDYRATEEQRKAFLSRITTDNYKVMIQRLSKVDTDYKVQPSTNLLNVLKNLQSDDSKWVDKLLKQY